MRSGTRHGLMVTVAQLLIKAVAVGNDCKGAEARPTDAWSLSWLFGEREDEEAALFSVVGGVAVDFVKKVVRGTIQLEELEAFSGLDEESLLEVLTCGLTHLELWSELAALHSEMHDDYFGATLGSWVIGGRTLVALGKVDGEYVIARPGISSYRDLEDSGEDLSYWAMEEDLLAAYSLLEGAAA
jgi:hypothetical protein